MSLPKTMLFMCIIVFIIEQFKIIYLSIIQSVNNSTINILNDH